MKDTFIDLINDHRRWATETFPEATAYSSLEKLKTEIEEVEKELPWVTHAINADKFPLAVEYADCLMCIFDSASRVGLSAEHLFDAFREKMETNKQRKWVKNHDNSYSHIKE